ncbi:MAG TPA: hypothetical protein VGM72_12905 [Micropepsaceae bacterium]|jgi:hypothetical protein
MAATMMRLKTTLAGCAFVLFLGSAALSAQEALNEQTPIPDFSSGEASWIAQGVNFQLPSDGPHQITNDPAHPFKPPGRGEAPTFRVADLDNPILQDWTREELRKRNEHILGGGTGYTRQVSCWPMGVPAFLLYPAQPLYIVQAPKQVLLIAQMNNEPRHVYLNVPHSRNVKPSWYGESIGHYEGGTLVVDTIGMNNQTWIDNYRTPHSDKLHVVERFHIAEGGKTLQVDVHVEDPGAFTMPWDTVQRYDRTQQGALVEFPCAENNADFGNLDRMPIAEKPDF